MKAAPVTSAPHPEPRAPWRELWALVSPKKDVLALGLGLVLVNRASGLVLPGSMRFLVDDVIGRRRAELMGPLVGAVLLATLVQGITSLALTQLLSKEAQRLVASLRKKVQAHLLTLPVSFHDGARSGSLLSRVLADVEGFRNLLDVGLVGFVGGLLTAVASLAALLWISPSLTGLAMGIVLVFALLLRGTMALLHPLYRRRSELLAELTGRLAETFGGIRVVKAYRAEARERAAFSRGVDAVLGTTLRALNAMSVLSLASTVFLGAIGAAVMTVGARQILAGTLTLGSLVTYGFFLGLVIVPVLQIVSMGSLLSEALAGLSRTRELLRLAPEGTEPRRTRVLGEIRGEVQLTDVRFAYEPGVDVLDGVSFRAAPGTVTALVGPSGSGKSTIAGLVASFHAPSSGEVTIDDVDLATVCLDSYRSRLGVVLQETFLFEGTLRENVAFARPDAAPGEVLEACRVARVHEFAVRLPQGYDTLVGERGVRLSGGQRQRVSIARALLADPKILILDEATSSLDSESEGLVQDALARLLAGRTTLVIAHRLSTIRRADQILVLEAGRIVERGTHATLLAARGRYHDMCTRQQSLVSDLLLGPGEGEGTPEEAAAVAPLDLSLRSGLSVLRGPSMG